MFCPNCGTKLDDSAVFCGSCGTPIKKSASPAPQAPPPIQQAPPIQQTIPLTPPPVRQAAPPPIPAPIPQPIPAAPQPKPQPVSQAIPQAPYNPNLKFEKFGGNLPGIIISLNQGESIYTESGGMTWMTDGIVMETNMKGGLMKGLGRMMSGDSLFVATYTATTPNQQITIASSFPGDIADIKLEGQSIIAQKSAFLCAQPSVTLSAHVAKGIRTGLFGGEGFVLQKLTGMGHVFLEIDGSLVERTLKPGERLKVDTGNVAAYEESVDYSAEMVKGFKNVLFGGEGLFLATLTGPGKVWLQTMTLPGFAKQLIPFLPNQAAIKK